LEKFYIAKPFWDKTLNNGDLLSHCFFPTITFFMTRYLRKANTAAVSSSMHANLDVLLWSVGE